MTVYEDDLRLARAAAHGEPAAIAGVEALLADLGPAVRRIDGSPAFGDEVRRAARVRLLVADERARAVLRLHHVEGLRLAVIGRL